MNLIQTLLDSTVSLKSLGVSACVGGAAVLLWRHRERVLGYAAIGLYPNVLVNTPSRVIQNLTMDHTRKDVRRDFYPIDSLESTEPTRTSDNGHPVSGAVRDCARRTIDQALLASGLTKLEISPSDRSNCDRSIVQYYAPNDLERPISNAKPTATDVVVGIDVDYYIKDFGEVFGMLAPCLFHTFQPQAVAGKDGDAFYRVKDNKVVYEVGGGNVWSHNVWDWAVSGEFIETDVVGKNWFDQLGRNFLWILGLHQVVFTKVHHSRPWKACPHRLFVWTIPQFTVWKWRFLPTNLGARRLKHIVYADKTRPGWNSIVYVNQEGNLRINFGRDGEDATVDLLKEDFDILMGLQSQQSVTSRMIGMKYTDSKILALTGQYYRKGVSDMPDPTRLVRSTVPKVHWPIATEAEQPEVSSRQYSAPLVTDHNLMPMIRRWEAMSLSIDRRVTFYKNDKVPNKKIQAYAIEFAKLVVPVAHEGVPYTLEETAMLLDKPSQVLATKQVWETVEMAPQKKIEAFMKNEACMKSARIISSYPDIRFLLQFSQYTLKYRDDVLHNEHNKHWFCPGKSPVEIAKCVMDYAAGVDEIGETDFENLDGTTSKWLQMQVYVACMLRYYHPDYHFAIREYANYLLSIPAFAKRFNFKYEPGEGVKSGNPATCDGNTHTNGFEEYCCIRETFSHLTSFECFCLIGPKFGDDGLTRRELKRAHTKVCDQLGLRMKFETCLPDTGVTFLARVYVDPWTTSTTMQDPLRTWRKLHLTTRDPNVPLETAALDRLDGYMVTDRFTPITSDYCQMIQRSYIAKVAEDTKRSLRLSKDREKTYWLTQGGAWPQDPNDYDLMFNCISVRTGFDKEVLDEFRLHLQQLNNPWELRSLNRDEEPCPYKDTLDEDAMPTEPLDARQIQEDVESKHLRANPETTRTSRRENQSPGGGTPPSRSRRRGNPTGFAKFPNLPKSSERKVGKGGNGTNTKTAFSAGAERRTNSSKQPISPGANKSPQAGPSGIRRPTGNSGAGTAQRKPVITG